MPKDIKNLLDGIEEKESERAESQSKIDRLTELVEKQRKTIDDQNAILEEQKHKIGGMFDVPEDIVELKAIIGTQRAELTEKDSQFEMAQASAVEAQKELELIRNQFGPVQAKIEEYSTLNIQLKTKLSTAETTLKFKDDELMQQLGRISELEVLERQFGVEFTEKVQQAKEEFSREKMDLEARIKDLESQMLDGRLASSESQTTKDNVQKLYVELTQKHTDLISKYDQTKKNFSDLNDQIKKISADKEELLKFKKENLDIITYFQRMKPIFEEEAIFKTFVIVREVGTLPLSDLKNALGLPTITIQKYVQKFIDNKVFKYNDVGDVTLEKDFLEE